MYLPHLTSLIIWLTSLTDAYTDLSSASLASLPSSGTDFDITTGAILSPILIPRVPGTPGSTKVQSHFRSFFQHSLPSWNITFQNSTSTTPTSKGAQVPFRNFIAHRDPPWAQRGDVSRLTLVAHYDSLSVPAGFIGAIDSAAPCAMIMHAMRSIDGAMTRRWEKMQRDGVGEDGLVDTADNRGIQVIFLDGEEAFLAWSDTDSVYGARALAEEWEGTAHPMMAAYSSPLQAIELFVLLDLLGAKDTDVPSYFKTTHWAYQKMAGVEAKLRAQGLLKSKPVSKKFLTEAEKKDSDRWLGGHIGDDHTPFMARGVDILHLIPSRFPDVWHTIHDDGKALDADTVEDWGKLIAAFSAEWLDLEGFMVEAQPLAARDEADAKDELHG
ncbi:peptidase M28 [Myriangium duriaei CBS 260.36]|uniref:Peptide hydrolase n=1 Tax=Myriangium duriaei CBS 260.36 TaxID=1168546 RepID=A0A9P4IW17_9PEZI|nr:peptidase M28 [Myriangium duriaei CBS 260.36]